MHHESSGVRQLFRNEGKVAITSRNSKTGETYLALFNISENSNVEVSVNLADLDLKGNVRITNIWSNEEIGVFKDSFSAKISAHASGLYKLTKSN